MHMHVFIGLPVFVQEFVDVSHPCSSCTLCEALPCAIQKNVESILRRVSPGEVDAFIFQDLPLCFYQIICRKQTESK